MITTNTSTHALKGICPHNQRHLPPKCKASASKIHALKVRHLPAKTHCDMEVCQNSTFYSMITPKIESSGVLSSLPNQRYKMCVCVCVLSPAYTHTNTHTHTHAHTHTRTHTHTQISYIYLCMHQSIYQSIYQSLCSLFFDSLMCVRVTNAHIL